MTFGFISGFQLPASISLVLDGIMKKHFAKLIQLIPIFRHNNGPRKKWWNENKPLTKWAKKYIYNRLQTLMVENVSVKEEKKIEKEQEEAKIK